jgi:hypothetical protein
MAFSKGKSVIEIDAVVGLWLSNRQHVSKNDELTLAAAEV